MPPSTAGRRRAAAVLAAALVPPLLVAVTPSASGAPPRVDRVVRLAADPGSPVRSAETGLSAGVTRLGTSTYSLVAATWYGRAPAVSVRTTADGGWQRLAPLGSSWC
jgi:hypothetical protein